MKQNNLKKIRINKGLTQQGIAKLVGVDIRSYRRYESGEIQPSLENLIKLSEVLEESPLALYENSDSFKIIKSYLKVLSKNELTELQSFINECIDNATE